MGDLTQIMVVKEKKFDNKQTANLSKVLTASQMIKETLREMQGANKGQTDVTRVSNICSYYWSTVIFFVIFKIILAFSIYISMIVR